MSHSKTHKNIIIPTQIIVGAIEIKLVSEQQWAAYLNADEFYTLNRLCQ